MILSIKSEIKKVLQAMSVVKRIPKKQTSEDKIVNFSDAAKEIGITKDTLRNWERNSFFSSLRNSSNRKYVNQEIIEKLKMIYCLRLSGFSMSFIHMYLKDPEQINTLEIYSAGDHLLEFLTKTLDCAKKIPTFLK